MELPELVAREQIRDTLARYNWAGDAGRADDLAQTFCAEGTLEIRGLRVLHGRPAIADFLSGVTTTVTVSPGLKAIVRHNVTNVMVDALTAVEATVSCYFTVFTQIGVDHFGRYRDTMVPVGDRWLIKHRKVSTDWAATDSVMARA